MKNIAIIGAGMTGLSLAYNLQEHNITIFDKSWRPGGRVSTRKHDNYLFDHGAHYLSTNHSVNQLNEVISRYNLGKVIEIDFATDYLKNKKTRKKIIIGQNGMNSIPKSIFDNIKVKSYLNSKIIKVSKNSISVNSQSFPNPKVGSSSSPEANISNDIISGIEIKSPIIGTAYHAPEPGAKKFVEVGKKIKKGDTIMIVEAMKTMNHVPSTADGVVKEICVEDGQPVEFGQTIIILE